jgi:hypothetical protein
MLGAEPRRPLSTGLAPVSAPPFFTCTWRESAIAHDHSISPAALSSLSSRACSSSHTPAFLPLVEPSPAGRARAEAKLDWQMPPGNPRMQDEQDPAQRLAIRQALATRTAEAPLLLRQQRLDPLPQLVRYDPRRNSHRHLSRLDDRCRRPSWSVSGSLHFDSSSEKRGTPRAGAPVETGPAETGQSPEAQSPRHRALGTNRHDPVFVSDTRIGSLRRVTSTSVSSRQAPGSRSSALIPA